MVALTLSFSAMGVIAHIVVYGNRNFTRESHRIEQNDSTRSAMNYIVRTLRESGSVILTDDLDQDDTKEGTLLGVNFNLDDSGTGKAAVRDGLVFFTDREHQTVYFDKDEEGSPGSGFPDISGFDDRDEDGKSDLVGIGLIPQLNRNSGHYELSLTQKELQEKEFPYWSEPWDVPNYMIDPIPTNEGFSPVYWKLVFVTFGNLSEVNDVSKWQKGRSMVTHLRPYVFSPKTSKENFDTIGYEGFRVESYDYGNDTTFGTFDTGENDGKVDENEIGSADPASQDNHVNTAKEIRLISTVMFNLNCRRRFGNYKKERNDDYTIRTYVSPRAIMMVGLKNLKFPVPAT